MNKRTPGGFVDWLHRQQRAKCGDLHHMKADGVQIWFYPAAREFGRILPGL